mgnify:CR=1 FL=1
MFFVPIKKIKTISLFSRTSLRKAGAEKSLLTLLPKGYSSPGSIRYACRFRATFVYSAQHSSLQKNLTFVGDLRISTYSVPAGICGLGQLGRRSSSAFWYLDHIQVLVFGLVIHFFSHLLAIVALRPSPAGLLGD